MASLIVTKTSDGTAWHVSFDVSDVESEVGGSLTGVSFYACDDDIYGSGCVNVGSYTPGVTHYESDVGLSYFALADTVGLIATNGESNNHIVTTTANPFGGDGGGGGTFPTPYAYTTLTLSTPDGDSVTDFHVAESGADLLASWDKFPDAGHYRLQVRRDSDTLYTEFAFVEQQTGATQTFSYTSFLDDARFIPGMLYVFRIRAEA